MISVPERATAIRKGGARDLRCRLLSLAAAVSVLGIFIGVII